MGILGKTDVSKFERKYQKFQNMKEMKSKQYMTPSIKVVKFQVEQGFAGSDTTTTINQTGTEYDGMNEKMTLGNSNNGGAWNWHINE